MTENADALAELIVWEMGKALPDAKGEVAYAAEFFRWYAEEAVRNQGMVTSAPAGDKNLMVVITSRSACSLLITPWNFPAAMATRKIGPALAAGCSVILKPASDTPLTALAIAALLTDAGVPDGVVNVVPSRQSGNFAEALLRDPRVRKLSFTGSTEVGRGLLALASDQIIDCSMELGGNAPFLVLDDADIDAAVEGAMVAKMRNGGEACTAANRFYVHESVADEFTRQFAEAMAAAEDGSGSGRRTSQLGPLINESQREEVAGLVDSALAGGCQGRDRRRGSGGQGLVLPGHGARQMSRRTPRSCATRSSVRWRRSCASRSDDEAIRDGQRHRVRAGVVPVHQRPRPWSAGQRGARDRHGRRQPRPGVRPRGTVRRREAERHRPRGRQRRHARVPWRASTSPPTGKALLAGSVPAAPAGWA